MRLFDIDTTNRGLSFLAELASIHLSSSSSFLLERKERKITDAKVQPKRTSLKRGAQTLVERINACNA